MCNSCSGWFYNTNTVSVCLIIVLDYCIIIVLDYCIIINCYLVTIHLSSILLSNRIGTRQACI